MWWKSNKLYKGGEEYSINIDGVWNVCWVNWKWKLMRTLRCFIIINDGSLHACEVHSTEIFVCEFRKNIY
jgi:hypothetical protein